MGGGRIATALGAPGPARLVPYLTAGFPSVDATVEMATALAGAGAGALEVGIPFSDPIADGPDIQRASEWALRRHVGMPAVLDTVARIRERASIPIVLMTYANPILRFGPDRFARAARDAGADGVLISDLPPDELPELWQAMDAAALDTVVLVAPTTDPGRLPLLVARARGFVYCLARTGVTGGSAGVRGNLEERIATIRRMTQLPVGVGFGIGSPADAAVLRHLADAVVVGAAFMRAIASGDEEGAVGRVEALGASLAAALRNGA